MGIRCVPYSEGPLRSPWDEVDSSKWPAGEITTHKMYCSLRSSAEKL